MLKFLDDRLFLIKPYEWCPIVVKNKEFVIDGRKGSVGCVSDEDTFVANPKTQSILKLWTFLSILEDQPITLHFADNNWIYIKEAIL